MTRGVAHPPELRAEVIAAVIAGTSLAQAAARFNLDKGLISRWVASAGLQDVATKKVEADTELIMAYFRAALRAMIAQTEIFSDPDYCRSQDADKLATAHGVLGDKLAGIAATAQALGLIGPAPESSLTIDGEFAVLDAPGASESA